MLRHLRVTNFSILSDVSIDLGDGLNVLTGETGAGKSLIVEAVNLLRGGRASADIPRAGADEAVVEAIFEVPRDLRTRVFGILDGAGLPRDMDDGRAADADTPPEVSVRRTIQRGGRSRTYVNGALTTAARLAELGGVLVDLSGQHQHQGLVDPARHREILDAFAAIAARTEPAAREVPAPLARGKAKGKRAVEAIAEPGPRNAAPPITPAAMVDAWGALRQIDDTLAALGGDEREREARADYLRYQLEELDGAALALGEDVALEAERVRLAAVDQLAAGVRRAEELAYGGEDSATDKLGAARRELDRLLRLDPALAPVAAQLDEARALLADAASTLGHYADRLEGDPERLAAVDDRLALIRRLCRKHGGGLDVVVARHAELRAELAGLAGRDARVAELTAARAAAEASAAALASALSDQRRRAAGVLEQAVAASLAELGMGAAQLAIVLEPRPLGPCGVDHVELMLRSNRGEEARPLAKIASGGELSRIMLALKLALRRADEVATYVFDEVDTGIGGATAGAVGAQIRGVGEHRQVLCVTHLPQIAAFADHHFHVEKAEVAGRTETHVRRLGVADRKAELARMLGGQATAKARAHAAELLAEAARASTARAA
jgi:DNA repair protein RecN (Recombination protein N)